MTGGRIERRLAAILAMDVAGYSRLMEADESGTLAMVKSLRTEAIEPAVGAHRGRVVKTTGDGLLLEFPSAASAVECAIALQSAIAAATADAADDRRLRFRIGLTLGDVMIDGDDIYGDGVNIAARLEQMAEPGAILVSAALYNQLGGDLRGRFETLGERRLKNLSQPVQVYRLRASADSVATRASEGPRAASPPKEQEIRFCRTADGVTIAYSAVGSGPTLIKAANWLNHLEFDWISPVWRGLFEDLSRDHRLVRYDERGNGLSDWDVETSPSRRWCRISKPSSPKSPSNGSPCSAFRRVARSRSPMPSSIPSG
jgi:class 3 adenylate cyclase